VGVREIIYRHRERRPQLLSGQTRPISTGQEISRTASDYEREGEQVTKEEWLLHNQTNGDDGTGHCDYQPVMCGDCLRSDCEGCE